MGFAIHVWVGEWEETFAVVLTEKETVLVVVVLERDTVCAVPPPVQDAPSPPLAVVLVGAQLRVTVPTYPPKRPRR